MAQTPTVTTTQTFGRPFQPGAAWTGNRKGRPPVGESVADYIRQLAGPDAKAIVDRLFQIATGEHKDVNARIKAAELLLTRGYGKPPDNLNISGSVARLDPAKLARLSDEELAQAAALVAKLADDDQVQGVV